MLAIVVGCSLAASGPALASKDRISADVVRDLVGKGELMPLEEILRRNDAALEGRILEIELERKSAGYVYEIKVLRPDGRKFEVKVNGQTGDVISGRR